MGRGFGLLRRGVLLGVLACAAAVGLTLPPPATAAGGGLHYELQTAGGFGPDSLMAADAICPTDLSPVGGGIFLGTRDFSLEVAGTFPAILAPSNDEWGVLANNSTDKTEGVGAWAICGPGTMFYQPASVDVPPGDQASATAKCPGGTKLTGGGVRSDASDVSMEVAQTAPTPHHDGWRGAMNNDPPGGTQGAPSHTMTVWAACASTGRYRYVMTPSFVVPNQNFAGREALCPRRTRVTGGGITNTGLDLGTELAEDIPIDTRRDSDTIPDDGWRAVAQNDVTGSGPESARVFAICKRV